ncbi:MAG: dTMP kinase [Sphaerochaetaceae bacterium]|nr:dTMP kinase [Sphaerochaetaceae bacterium]
MTNILKNFWVLEGLDGAGTTTQLKNIDSELSKTGLKYMITAEPTDSETGKIIRRVLSGEFTVPQSTVARLFSADRDNHLYNTENGVVKNINEGKIVVSDRYFFSSLAYQSIGYDFDTVMLLNSTFPYPEYVIYIDTPVEDCIQRINSRGQAKEIYEKYEYQVKVKQGYERCFSSLPEGCNLLRIKGDLSREEIFEEIKNKLINKIL